MQVFIQHMLLRWYIFSAETRNSLPQPRRLVCTAIYGVCVSTPAAGGAAPLVKSCKMYRCGYATFLPRVFPSFFPLLPPKKSLDQVSDVLKTWQGYRKAARLGVFVYLKKESCTFSTFSHRYFFFYKSNWRSEPALKAEIKSSQRNIPEECESDPTAVRNAHTVLSVL